jgi:acyl carrier protein
MEAILDRLNGVFRAVFDDDELEVEPGTSAKDVDGWDSMMHVRLLINVERTFGIKFSFSEIAQLKDVGDLISLIEAKSAAKR